VTLPGTGGTVSFKYDPFGRRIYRSSSSGTGLYAYDGDNLIEETNVSGAVVTRYLQGLYIDEPLAMLRSSTTSYYEADGLGSVRSLSSPAGSMVQTYVYDSFGKQTNSSGSLMNPFQYSALEQDPETSVYYYRARYYDPQIGRFLNEDPEGFGASVNFYAYVDNDPVDWTDPAGLDKVQVCCRPLRKLKPLLIFRIWHHCYIQFLDDSGNITDTYGVLPDRKGGKNQIPRHGNGVNKDDGNPDRNSGGKCKDLPAAACQLNKLKQGLQNDVESGTCPSCGTDYHNWWWKFAGNNSNTFIFNMLQGAGITPPREPRSPGYNPAPGPWY
jgi:RHS repeat-associated protein